MSNKHKLLVVPAISDHVAIIKKAQERGMDVITADNNMLNEGHKVANKSFNIDILDYNALHKLAEDENIDFALGYSTDIGALAAASVNEHCKIKSNSYKTVEIMSHKGLFRQFLLDNGFATPKFYTFSNIKELENVNISYPVIIKPIDRASSKGITIIRKENELTSAFKNAQKQSFLGKVIIEEYITMQGKQLHGDVLVQNGHVIFYGIGDQYFQDNHQSLAPIGTVFPSEHTLETHKKLRAIIQQFVTKIGYKQGGINVEARLGKNGKMHLIEMAARSGGNYIPELLSHITNSDYTNAILSALLGKNITETLQIKKFNLAQIILRSPKSGILKSFIIPQHIELIEHFPNKIIGEYVSNQAGVNNIISVIIIRTENIAHTHQIMQDPIKYFSVIVDPESR